MKISVIICTHNPNAEKLAKALEALRRQTLASELWELCLIDNGSSIQLANEVSLDWHPNGRVIREDQLGLTNARLRGFKETEGELLVLVDDDNVLDSDYLLQSLRIAEAFPQIGAFGGSVVGEFIPYAPQWFSQFEFDLLGVRPISTDCWSNLPWLWESTPIGAGMVVRRKVAAAYSARVSNDSIGRALDRKGASLVSGGDSDITCCACEEGYGLGRFKALSLRHLIDPERIELPYLCRLAEGIGFSQSVLERMHGVASPQEGGLLFRGLSSLIARYQLVRMLKERRLVRHAYHRGQRKGLALPPQPEKDHAPE